jgi:CRP/FNR family transcriptional regulator, cyclic AMP receptor protein
MLSRVRRCGRLGSSETVSAIRRVISDVSDTAWDSVQVPVPLRSRIGDAIWDEILLGAPVLRAGAGAVLCRTGDPPRLTAVTAGLVRVFTWAPGGRQVPLRYARAGDLVGLAALLGDTRMLSAEAVSDVALAFPSIDRLRSLATEHPDLPWTIARQVAAWGVASVSSLVGAGFEQMSVRVARHLLDLSSRAPDGRTSVNVTHRVLADAVGTAREVVTRVLREFREQGIVDTHAGRVVVVDPGRLARIAEGEHANGHEHAMQADGPPSARRRARSGRRGITPSHGAIATASSMD